MVGCDAERNTFGVYAFHRSHWLAVRRIPEKPPFLALAQPSL